MEKNPLLELKSYGQSIWLDYIHRHLIDSGGLQKLIEEDGLCGVTSNPSIFDKAIEGSDVYDDSIISLAREGKAVEAIFQFLTAEDVGRAADLFRPTFDKLAGGDGFVSMEVNPHLAHDSSGTITEARRLWALLNRPNVFIKVPSTLEGLWCIRKLTGEGININVTLLFGLPRYQLVAEAYIAGLEDRLSRGLPIDGIASVASFFLSRIDTMVDPLIKESSLAKEQGDLDLVGQTAISSAKIAYEMYKKIFGGERFRKLADHGARTQRVLWASTSTKDPAYPDTKYVDALIGPDTINTVPMETLKAYREHGNPAPRLEEDLDLAHENLSRLATLGIDLDKVTRQLEQKGIESFEKAYDSLILSIDKKRSGICLNEAC